MVAAAAPTPSASRRHVEIDAFPGVDRALTMERQMQAILGKQHMGEQLRYRPPARPPARDGAGGWLIASQARQENFSRACWHPNLK
jgi:hypothetical protein